MTQANYWRTALQHRIGRRRALIASGTTALGAAFLAACGGSGRSGTSNSSQPVSSLLTKIEDTSSKAKRGGILKDSRSSDTDSLDPYAANSLITSGINAYVYGRLTTLKRGRLGDPDGNVEGELAESWEWSPDRLTLTMKLRQGVKFHNVAPVNGRVMDADDVVYSWKRFAATGLLRTELVNDVNPLAPVASITATDSKTIVFKLKFPLAYVTTLFATPNSGNPHIVPKEAESAFDLRKQSIGTGPFMLSSYQPSVRFEYKRNPDYYIRDLPFLDGIQLPMISEYAAALAQLKASNLHVYNVRSTDILSMKKDIPELALYQGAVQSIGQRSIFGWNASPAAATPFRDERVRQAYSMSWDRDLFNEVVYNISTFEKEGLPVESRWNAEIQCNFFPGWWLDPKSKDFGENAKYFQHNVAEGKKLMAAAGYGSGVEVMSSFITTPQYGTDFPKYVEVLQGMAGEVGLRFKNNVVDYATEFATRYRDGGGKFEGISYKLGPSGGGDDAIGRMNFFNHSKGGGYSGHDVNGKGDFSGDATLDDMIDKAKAEVDANRRKALAQEMQRYLGKKLYTIRWPGGATSFELAWPTVRNFRAFTTLGSSLDARVEPYFWLDDTLPPNKS